MGIENRPTGNNIDSDIYNNIVIESCKKSEFEKDSCFCDIAGFEEKLKKAKPLLILGNSSGETVFDRILAEHLSLYNIKYYTP